MIEVLMSYYGLGEEDAKELLTELKDTKSLQSLAEYRVARAVMPHTAPDLHGV